MLQIGLSGLLTYVKASQRSAIINELLLSKDYISEIITIAADHFTTVSRWDIESGKQNLFVFLGTVIISNMSLWMYVKLSKEIFTIFDRMILLEINLNK